MHLIDNAGAVWHRFWSLRFAVLAAVLSGACVTATMVLPEHTSVRVALGMGLLTCASAVASALARVVRQPQLTPPPAGPASSDPVRAAAIADVRALMAAHGLTLEDVFGDSNGRH